MWSALEVATKTKPLTAVLLSDVGIRRHKTVQGIFRDAASTSDCAPPFGVTLSILYTGDHYEDAFDEDSGLYSYPLTSRPGRDMSEIEGTKNAARFDVPIFVIMPDPATRSGRLVRRAWVADWDDVGRLFLVSFYPAETTREDGTFHLRVPRREVVLLPARPRPGQARFRFSVFKRYGRRCAVCAVAVVELLEAVHLCGFGDGGTDDARNGLVLCRNHHRAFDTRLFAFEPGTGAVQCREGGPTLQELGIVEHGLKHLLAMPHEEALSWCWSEFEREQRRAGSTVR